MIGEVGENRGECGIKLMLVPSNGIFFSLKCRGLVATVCFYLNQ